MAMSDAPTQPVCPLGISERALSALRDDALSQAEAARLATHVAGCAACRARLAAFDDLAAILRSERAPEPDARLWQAVTAAVASSSPARRLRFPGGAPMRSPWGQLATIAAVLLLIVGFVALFNLRRSFSPSPTATPAPTLTPAPTTTPLPTATSIPLLPAQPLTWNTGTMPSSPQAIIFADDGESGYACSVGPVLHIWRTYNRGASWVPAQVVPNDPSMNLCELVVDVSDPSVAALAWAPRGSGAGDSFTGLMTTVDGGATWQTVPSQPFVRIDQLDSRDGVIYAIRETTDSSNSVEYHLWASSDRMRTWRQVDHGLPPNVAGFWLQPNGSSILVATSDGLTSSQLWLSSDGGATWRQLSVPGGLPYDRPARFAPFGSAPHGIVARWIQGQFHICASNATLGTTNPSSPSALTVACSTDSGVTWHDRMMLLMTTSQGVSISSNLVAIADDGAVLADDLNAVYRLAPGSSRWQSLGSPPQGAQPVVVYCPSPGAGILWTLPEYPASHIYSASYTP